MKNYFSLLAAGIFVLFAMSACEKAIIDNGATDKPLSGTGEPVSFQADIIPIFASNCVACHGSGGQTPVLEAASAYDNLINGGYVNTSSPASSTLYVKLATSGGSHFNRCSDTDKEKILNWITQGALNN